MSRPDYKLYGVNDKGNWVAMGSAWKRSDGSISIAIDSIPVNFEGNVMAHPNNEKEEKK